MEKSSTRYYSDMQENYIAKITQGKKTPGSGGTKFGGGDVKVTIDKYTSMLIEAKTTTEPKESFSIKKAWIEKVKEQSFEQGCELYALAFRFGPYDDDYYVLDEKQFLEYLELLNATADDNR